MSLTISGESDLTSMLEIYVFNLKFQSSKFLFCFCDIDLNTDQTSLFVNDLSFNLTHAIFSDQTTKKSHDECLKCVESVNRTLTFVQN